MTKTDLEALAHARLEDASLLLQMGRSSSAYYLAGYAVELALKTCIAKSFRPNVIPDREFVSAVYSHKLDSLLGTAGLLPKFKTDSQEDVRLAAAWGIPSKWTESSRYELWDNVSASNLITAIADPQHGVFHWVKKHW